jgi:predicted dehydrogenase
MARRRFLGGSVAAIASPYIIKSTALGGEGQPAAGDRIALGAIGIGSRGNRVMESFLANPGFQVVAICDPQANRCSAAQNKVNGTYRGTGCVAYRDLRELLARKDIDAVMVATGDRWHATASILAAKAGKDVYCEKPMSLTIAEGRAVADAMRRYGRVYQCGTQRRNDPRFAHAAEAAKTGKLGRFQTVHAYTPGFVRNVGAFWARPAEPAPPRDVVDWDLWLGPPAWREYNKGYVGGLGGWSHVPDLGGGGITDWGTHQADLALFANDAEGTSPTSYESPNPKQVVCTYANGVKLVFNEGIPGGACLMARFEGSDGWISVDDNHGVEGNLPAALGPYQQKQRGSELRPANHIKQFLECIRSRKQPACNAEVAHRATTACHAANICLRVGRPLKWDPVKEEFPGDEQANALRGRPAREPWGLTA